MSDVARITHPEFLRKGDRVSLRRGGVTLTGVVSRACTTALATSVYLEGDPRGYTGYLVYPAGSDEDGYELVSAERDRPPLPDIPAIDGCVLEQLEPDGARSIWVRQHESWSTAGTVCFDSELAERLRYSSVRELVPREVVTAESAEKIREHARWPHRGFAREIAGLLEATAHNQPQDRRQP